MSLCSLGVAVCGCVHRLVCVSTLCELISGLFGVHGWTGNCMIILKILQNIHYAVCMLNSTSGA